MRSVFTFSLSLPLFLSPSSLSLSRTMGHRRSSRGPVNVLFGWVRRQSVRVKVFLAAAAAILTLIALMHLVHDHNHFFVASEAVHAAGILVLIVKLTRQKTCSGLSLKSQELTAVFLAVRLYCSFALEKNIHTFLDFATLVSTLWVIYMIRFKLKSSYRAELDSMPRYYLMVPSIVLAILLHPITHSFFGNGIFWAFSMYLESVSVLPQLQLMQNAKMIEPFTSHYVFALGIARFLGCAHWIIRFIETRGAYLSHFGTSLLWGPAALLSEIVQTFILADFCYYYVKSSMFGDLLTRYSTAV